MYKRKKYEIHKIVVWLLVLLVMDVIYRFSAQSSITSHQISDHFLINYKRVIQAIPWMPHQTKRMLLANPVFFVRKLAHLTIFALLGAVTLLALWQTKMKRGKCFFGALVTCVAYALTDEWHQLYSVGRGARLSDVAIDGVGALIGMTIMLLVIMVIKRIKKYTEK